MRIVQVTPPAVEPVTTSDVANLQIRVTSDLLAAEGSLIDLYISAARELCEARSHLCFITQTYQVFWDTWGLGFAGPGAAYGTWGAYGSSFFAGTANGSTLYTARAYDRLALPYGPVQSVDWVKYVDASGTLQTLDPSKYIVSTGNPGRISLVQNVSWPTLASQPDCVQVQFKAGFGDTATSVPARAKQAILLQLGHYFRQRSAQTDVNLSTIGFGVDELLNSLSCGNNLFA